MALCSTLFQPDSKKNWQELGAAADETDEEVPLLCIPGALDDPINQPDIYEWPNGDQVQIEAGTEMTVKDPFCLELNCFS